VPEDDLWKTLKEVGAAVGQAQAFNRSNSYILMELVRDLARVQPDPQQYLSDVFERVSARADLGPIEEEAHPSTVEFRNALSQFFVLAGKNLEKRV
jgi:hypothetical protein